jgi:hypothetical protein
MRLLAVAALGVVLTACGPTAAPAPPAAPTPHPTEVLTVTGCVVGPGGQADYRCDPGALNPDVTPTTLSTTICRPGWAETVRPPTSYTTPLKRLDMARYGLTGPITDYRYDHLVAIELGGALRDPANLWPQPKDPAVLKNTQAGHLRDQVCRGEITLAVARATIVRDWTHHNPL